MQQPNEKAVTILTLSPSLIGVGTITISADKNINSSIIGLGTFGYISGT